MRFVFVFLVACAGDALPPSIESKGPLASSFVVATTTAPDTPARTTITASVGEAIDSDCSPVTVDRVTLAIDGRALELARGENDLYTRFETGLATSYDLEA